MVSLVEGEGNGGSGIEFAGEYLATKSAWVTGPELGPRLDPFEVATVSLGEQ